MIYTILVSNSRDYLAEKGYDQVYGARPLKRLMIKEIINEISGRIVRGIYQRGSFITIDAGKDGLEFIESAPFVTATGESDDDEPIEPEVVS